jgi:hypothetical protein
MRQEAVDSRAKVMKETVESVESSGFEDDGSAAWRKAWPEKCRANDWKKTTCEKCCPRCAGHALWQLGRFKGSARKRKDSSIKEVMARFGKNGVYAVLAADALLRNEGLAETKSLWEHVQGLFRKHFPEQKPAQSENGQIVLVLALHDAGLLQ